MNDPAVAGVRPTLVRYQVLGWFCILSMVTYIDRVCIRQVRDDMQSALGLSQEQFGWVFAAFALSYALLEVPSGWLGDRHGPRRILIRIVLWWSLFTVLTGCVWRFTLDSGYRLPWLDVPLLFDSFLLLLLIRFLFGAGEAGAYPNIARALRNWFPYSRRGLTQGWLWTFGRLGGAVAPLLIGLFAHLLGWRGAFAVFGLMGAMWVIGFAIWYRDRPSDHPEVNAAERAYIESERGNSGEQAPLSWQTLLSSPTLWCLCLMYFFSNAGVALFITWDVEYYKSVLHLSDRPLLWVSGGPMFCGAFGCLLGGLLTDRLVLLWGKRWGRAVQGVMVNSLAGLLFLLASLTTEPVLAVSLLCLGAFIKDFNMAISWSACLDVGHRYSGTVAGFMNMIGNLGNVVSARLIPGLVFLARPEQAQDWPMAAWLANITGVAGDPWKSLLLYSGILCIICGIFWLFINPRRVIVYAAADRDRLRSAGELGSE